MTHAVVIGAGVAGLSAAAALRREGVQVTVVDGATRVGGKLMTSAVADLDVDDGAESFLLRVPEAREVAAVVGLASDVEVAATTSAGVWARGRLRPLPGRTLLGIPSSLSGLHGVLSAGEVARAAVDGVLPATRVDGDIAVGALVRQRLGGAVVERLVDPLLGGVYAGHADELSWRATMPQLPVQPRSLLAAVRAVLPPSGSEAVPVFGTVRGGLGRLAEAMAAHSGAHLLLGRLVRRVERTDGGFRVVHGPTTDERVLDADVLVVAVPAAPAARLLTNIAPAAATDLATIDAASVALVTTAWRRGELGELSGSGYLVPSVYGRPVKAVTFMSRKWASLRGDVEIVRCSFGRYHETSVLQRDDEDLVALAVEELEATVGSRGKPVAWRVSRWGGALPQYAVGHIDKVARIRAAVAAVGGLAVCGAAYDGVGIPACIRSGRAAADALSRGLRTQ